MFVWDSSSKVSRSETTNDIGKTKSNSLIQKSCDLHQKMGLKLLTNDTKNSEDA